MTEITTAGAENNENPNSGRRSSAGMFRRIRAALSSAKLAMTLLVVILACCVTGVTIIRGDRAWYLIFSTLWFNGILTLLVVNIAFCFFGRIWGRKLTLVSFGMILFHLSFIAILGGVVYNSLTYFRGYIRLTEGESLPNADPRSYDAYDHGRYFSFSTMKGETTLVRMHAGYTAEGEDKRAAYEVRVGDRNGAAQGVIYITKKIVYNGFQYFNDREGYSLLVTYYDKQGRELFGAYLPLQSLKQKDNSYFYTTGTKDGPAGFAYPQHPLKPLYSVQVSYAPSPFRERSGEVAFQVRALDENGAPVAGNLLADEKAPVGEKVRVGEFFLAAREVRYWAIMSVRREPGKPVVLASLWAGLSGMLITFIGRMLKSRG